MWLHRRIVKISWTDHITNHVVLEKIEECKEILTYSQNTQFGIPGIPVMRNDQRYELLLILHGKWTERKEEEEYHA